MPSDFNTIRKLYDDDKFVELLHHPKTELFDIGGCGCFGGTDNE
jgi:hypothetical protein